MKAVQVLLVTLNVGAALSLKAFPFKVREVSNASIQEGPETRIYGGDLAPEGKFPFMIYALMKVTIGMSQCSTSLIKTDWVLLAAHCVYFRDLEPDNILLVGGKTDLLQYVRMRIDNFYLPINEALLQVQERRAHKFYYHPKYDPERLEHDVALIKVKNPFVLGPVALIPISEDRMRTWKICTILGWGLSEGNRQTFKLRYVENETVFTADMGCKFKNSGPFICLEPNHKGICQGDSGSPLVCEGKVWGVASHIVSTSSNPDCGDSLEEYYSELYKDLEWIRSIYNGRNLSSVTKVTNMLLCVLAGIWFSERM